MIQLQFRIESGIYGQDVRVSFDALERDTVTDAERQMADNVRRWFAPLEKRGKLTENHWVIRVELRSESDEEEE